MPQGNQPASCWRCRSLKNHRKDFTFKIYWFLHVFVLLASILSFRAKTILKLTYDSRDSKLYNILKFPEHTVCVWVACCATSWANITANLTPHFLSHFVSGRQNCHAWCPHSVCTSRKRLNSSSVRLGCGGNESGRSTKRSAMTVQIQTLRIACRVSEGSLNPFFQTFPDIRHSQASLRNHSGKSLAVCSKIGYPVFPLISQSTIISYICTYIYIYIRVVYIYIYIFIYIPLYTHLPASSMAFAASWAPPQPALRRRLFASPSARMLLLCLPCCWVSQT